MKEMYIQQNQPKRSFSNSQLKKKQKCTGVTENYKAFFNYHKF
jgi:hypothetical protein